MARGVGSAASQVLRHLTHPSRLRENAITAPYFPNVPSREGDESALVRIERVVAAAIASLPRLQQEMLRRCDIEGEAHRNAARALAISRRHFYRLRARAIAVVARALSEGWRHAPAAASSLDELTRSFLHADALEQAGASSEAVASLQRLGAKLGAIAERALIECRIAEICTKKGAAEEAKLHVGAADAILAMIPAESIGSAALAVDVARAFAHAGSGDSSAVEAVLRRLIPELRRIVDEFPTNASIEMLATALVVQGECRRDAGLLRDAVTAAREAGDLLRSRLDTRAIVRFRARYLETWARCLIVVEQEHALNDLSALGIEALRNGFIRESSLIVGDIAALHRVRGAPRRALEVALPALQTVRETCDRANVAIILFDVAASHGALHEFAPATRLVCEARTYATSPYARAIGELRAAELAMRRRCAAEAIEAATAARDGFAVLGNARLAAASMRVLAVAFDALGDSRAASTAIRESLELLSQGAFPFAIARTFRTAARITHDPRYAAAARKVQATA